MNVGSAKPLNLLALAALLAAMVFSVRVFISDWGYFIARKEAGYSRLNPEAPDRDHLDRAQDAIDQALKYWPNHPDYLTLAARIHAWQGYVLAMEQNRPQLVRQYYRESLEMLRKALELRPAHAQTWALVAEYKALIGERDEELHLAREKALELGGGNIDLINRMMAL